MTEMDSVMFVGCVNWDEIVHINHIPEPDYSVQVDEIYQGTGGSASNSSIGYASLGNQSLIVGAIGDDKKGEDVITYFTDHNVNTEELIMESDESTRHIKALITKDTAPRYIEGDGPKEEFTPSSVSSSAWDSINHLHITSFNKDIGNKFVSKAKEMNCTISFNPTQMYEQTDYPSIVNNADVIILNEEEFMVFRNRYNFEELRNHKTIVVTNGSAGCSVYTKDSVYTHEGFTAQSVVDTVGAGDSFVAGFLHKWISGSDLDDCAKFGNACGAYSVQNAGAPEKLQPEIFIKE